VDRGNGARRIHIGIEFDSAHCSAMDLHGTLSENLRAAMKSVLKYRGKPVHSDTLGYWEELVSHGRKAIRQGNPSPEVSELVRRLGIELSERHMGPNQLSTPDLSLPPSSF
jgi:microcystin degradation protein MlrC